MIQQLFLLLVLIFGTSAASAQSFVGPQASAMGGAGRAAVSPGESAFLNPATVPHFGEYFASGFYSQNEHPEEGEAQQLGLLLSDGAPDRLFQGALGYIHSNIDPIGGAGDVTTQDIYVALSSFVYKNVSFGLHAHRLVYKQTNMPDSTQFNGGAGVLWAYSKTLQFGLVASDILAPKETVPEAARLNKTYGAGMSYLFEDRFNFRLDLVRPSDQNPDNETDVMSGFETVLMQYMALRSGFRWNEALGPERRVFTAGVGFKGPKLRADYGFEKDTKVAGGIRHSFDLWMSF